MQRAAALLLLLAIMGAIVGVHVLMRKLAFGVETLQHSVFPGIAAAYVADVSLLLGAAVAAALSVAMFGVLRRTTGLDPDAVLAVLITMFVAVGVVVVSRGDSYQHDLGVLLFGRMLTVDGAQLIQTGVLAAIVVTVLALIHKELVLSAFDPDSARSLGYRHLVIDAVLNICVAITVIAAVRSVGTVLLVAFIVTPAVAARFVVARIVPMIAVAALVSFAGGLIGLAVSYQFSVNHGVDVPAGPSAVVAITTLFVLLAGARAVRNRISVAAK